MNDTAGVLRLISPPVKHTLNSNFDGASSVYAADVDGDGSTDILGAVFLQTKLHGGIFQAILQRELLNHPSLMRGL